MINIFRNALASFCFIFYVVSITGQSKWEYGIGIGINHSKINEDIKTISGRGSLNYKGLRLPALSTRIGYKLNDNIHLNTGPGFSWLGALQKDLSSRVVASTLELPLQIEWNPGTNIHFSTGPLYNFIVGMSNENDQMDFDMLPLAKTRHQLGLRHGIAVSHDLLELSLSFSHYLTDVFNFTLTDVNGNIIGTSVSKFSNIQLGIILRK